MLLLQPLIDFAIAHPDRLRLGLFIDGAQGGSAPESVARHLNIGRIDKSSIARVLGISDGAWSWSSSITNFWTRGEPNVGDNDIRNKNVLVLVCGPESYVIGLYPDPPADQISDTQDGSCDCRTVW